MFFIESSPGAGNVFEILDLGQVQFAWISLADELAGFDPMGSRCRPKDPAELAAEIALADITDTVFLKYQFQARRIRLQLGGGGAQHGHRCRTVVYGMI
jgi:hypothetical protein